MSERATRDAEAKPYTQAIGARGHATATRETDGKDPHDRSRAGRSDLFRLDRYALRMSPRAKGYQSRALRWRLVEENERKHLVLCQKEIASLARAAGELRARRHDFHPLQADELARQIVDQSVWWKANAAHTEAMITHSSMMGRKYEAAARYPWLSVAADRPAPYWSGVTGDPPSELAE